MRVCVRGGACHVHVCAYACICAFVCVPVCVFIVLGLFLQSHGQVLISHCEPSALMVTVNSWFQVQFIKPHAVFTKVVLKI